MMHDQEQLTQVNPYKLFTTLPLAFLAFYQFNYKLEI
jgi:hypothetical protein